MTNTELELLGLLQEECAEVIQIVSKVRRFGYDSQNPYDPSGKSNLTLLKDEVGDVLAILKLLLQEGNLKKEEIDERVDWKLQKLDLHWGYKLPPPSEDESKADRIFREILAAKAQGWRFIGNTDRKYLLREMVDLLTQLEELPEEENEN